MEVNIIKAWVIYSKTDYERNIFFANEIIKKGANYGIEIRLLITEYIEIGNEDSDLYIKYMGEYLQNVSFAIIRTIYPMLSLHLECMGISVYNNSSVSRICNDKALTLQLMSNQRINTVPTRYLRKEEINKDMISTYVNCVIKTVDGHGGKEVFYLKDSNELDDIMNVINNRDIIIQPFINSFGRDLRVYILNNKIRTAILRTSTSGFKSNFTLGGNAKIYELDESEIAIVEKICEVLHKNSSDKHGLVLAGIDFIIDENGRLLLSEIEDVVGCRMIYECTKIDIVDEYICTINKWQ